MTITVLLADDQALVPGGLRLIVNTQDDMQVVGEASDGREAIQLARRLRPDVVLMDIRMPHLDGLEATPPTQQRPRPGRNPPADPDHIRPRRLCV